MLHSFRLSGFLVPKGNFLYVEDMQRIFPSPQMRKQHFYRDFVGFYTIIRVPPVFEFKYESNESSLCYRNDFHLSRISVLFALYE